MCNFLAQNQKLFDELDKVINSLPDIDESSLIFTLKEAQSIFGYLPRDVQLYIAKKLKVAPAKVYGVVSFYSYFSTNPVGEHKISVCLGTACFVKGSKDVLAEIEKQQAISACTGHEWQDLETITDPACTTTGSKRQKCNNEKR